MICNFGKVDRPHDLYFSGWRLHAIFHSVGLASRVDGHAIQSAKKDGMGIDMRYVCHIDWYRQQG